MLYGFLAFLKDITDPEYWEYRGLPYGCRHCELLGICRRKKAEGWKCYNGCMILNAQYEGLPKGCWNCEYLTDCREPKENGWKCRNGCRKIREREEQK